MHCSEHTELVRQISYRADETETPRSTSPSFRTVYSSLCRVLGLSRKHWRAPAWRPRQNRGNRSASPTAKSSSYWSRCACKFTHQWNLNFWTEFIRPTYKILQHSDVMTLDWLTWSAVMCSIWSKGTLLIGPSAASRHRLAMSAPEYPGNTNTQICCSTDE